MKLLKEILNKLLFYFQFVLIFFYVVLEELVWERFAEPIYKYIKYLKPFEKLEIFLSKQNRYFLIFLFLISLIVGEGLGLLTPIVMVKGYVVVGIVIYGLKLLIAAFAFWVFNTQKEKLLTFAIINYGYEKIIYLKNLIQNSTVYIIFIQKYKKLKEYLKIKFINIKNFIINRFWR